MGIENNIPPTIEDAESWPVVTTTFQKKHNCDLTVKSEDPEATVPAHPDWQKTKLLEKTDGKVPKRLIELPNGKRLLFSYSYRDWN